MQARFVSSAVLAAAVTVLAAPSSAQRIGLATPPLPDEPIEYSTGERVAIRVVPLVRNLERPWSLAFLPDGAMLITERVGRVRLHRDGELLPEPIAGVPEVSVGFLGGLFDIQLHPDFESNNLVYLTYNKGREEGGAVLAVARGVFEGRALTEVEDILVADGGSGVSRMLFAPDGKLYVSVYGSSGEYSQDPASLEGKILRLNPDGSVPEDNPFVGRSGYRPEIYTMGHRSPEDLLWHEPTGAIWEVEMGPNGGDEVNVLEPGGNYGWPLVSLGRTYAGPWQSDKFYLEGMIDPVVYWMPSISTTGATFYTGDRFPAWQGNLFVGGVRYGEVPGTGQLQRIVFNENMEELRREALLADLRRRIRDVHQGPDGLLYVLTDEDEGALLRIEPVE